MRALLLFSGGAVLVYLVTRRSGDRLVGGRADGRKPSDFDAAQLELGTRVELEHTGDLLLAREIAMDHLVEDPRYYDKLLAAGL